MARKTKELDKLSLDMIECEKAGYGCHYGAWKATQDRPVVIEPDPNALPEGWTLCQYCGKPFKAKQRRLIKYCDDVCLYEAQKERKRLRKRAKRRENEYCTNLL